MSTVTILTHCRDETFNFVMLKANGKGAEWRRVKTKINVKNDEESRKVRVTTRTTLVRGLEGERLEIFPLVAKLDEYCYSFTIQQLVHP